jgi:uncharacterized protein (DUF2336 family)
MISLIDKILRRDKQTLTYEKAKELAGHEDEAVRAELAQRDDVRPEILYFLAEDPSPRVRRLIAENRATPPHADLILARDDDQAVRGGLAEKISRLAPGMDPGEQDKIKRMAYEALEVLTNDQVTRVRQILAEALKDVAGAPPDVIRRLAFDTEIVVAGPILENSPVLTDADLLEIISQGTAQGRLSYISKRNRISANLSDAIAATGDEEAVALLLGNSSAQIREETLDSIVEHAERMEGWHAPLVRRPKLSKRAVSRLAHFVAANLIDVLAARRDLAPDVLDEVKRVVDERIDAGEKDLSALSEPAEDSTTPLEEAYAGAISLHAAGELTLGHVSKVMKASAAEPVLAALAVLAELPILAVQKAVLSKNQKGLISIAWKAGLTADMAEKIQASLLELNPDAILRGEAGNFPMSDDDMEWQFEFVCDLA